MNFFLFFTLQVRLKINKTKIHIITKKKYYEIIIKDKLLVNGNVKKTLTIRDTFFIEEKNKWYPPLLKIKREKNQYVLINILKEDLYISSVIGAEIGVNAPLEALKALSVVIRTNIKRLNKIISSDNTEEFVYNGLETVTRKTLKAVKETKGKIIYFNNKPIHAFFHANSGGITSNPLFIWGKSYPYLKSIKDKYSKSGLHSQWHYETSINALSKTFGEPIIDIEAVSFYSDKRVKKIRILLKGKTVYMNGWIFRTKICKKYGWNTLKSSLFYFIRNKNKLIFYGKGAGHGVGLSEDGIINMSKVGKKWDEMIHFYFKNVCIK